MAKNAGAYFEAVERGLSNMLKSSKPVDQTEKLALQNELKTDQYGSKIDRIEIGPSGKALNFDDFKFDQNFGGKFHQPETSNTSDDYFGSGALSNYNNNNQFSSYQAQPGISSDQVNYFEPTNNNQKQDTQQQQPSGIKDKGFLDFNNIFSTSNSKPGGGQSYNPFN